MSKKQHPVLNLTGRMIATGLERLAVALANTVESVVLGLIGVKPARRRTYRRPAPRVVIYRERAR